MEVAKRLAIAVPKLIVATILASSAAVGCTVVFFYTLDFILGTKFFAQSPSWIPLVGVISWVFIAASVVLVKVAHQRRAKEGDLSTLAGIMIDQLRAEQEAAKSDKNEELQKA